MLAYEEMMSDEPQQEESAINGFEGFTPPTEEDYFTTLRHWRMIGARIANLAEYKIVDYLLQLTWGEGRPYDMMPLTTEAFMNGFVNEYGERIDNGTGLSRQSVLNGIEKAMKHGLIERHIEYYLDEHGITRATRYYGLHFYEPAEIQEESTATPQEEIVEDFDNTPFACEMPIHDLESVDLEPDEAQSLNDIPLSMEIENSNYLSNNNYCSNISRIQHLENLPEKGISKKKPRGKSKYPGFIRSYMESFSSDLGDLEHTASNISQATNIYLAYIANGGNAKAFVELMIQAKETTQKKSGIKHKNSGKKRNAMPYYFACLRNAARAATEPLAV